MYVAGAAYFWSISHISLPFVSMYPCFAPGGAHVSFTFAFAGSSGFSSGVATTRSGGGGSRVPDARPVRTAFCARFEKLLLRLDM